MPSCPRTESASMRRFPLTSIRLTEAASAVSIIVICTVVAPAITKLVVIATAETADINLEAAFIGPLNLLSPLSPREKPGLRQSVQPADYRNKIGRAHV